MPSHRLPAGSYRRLRKRNLGPSSCYSPPRTGRAADSPAAPATGKVFNVRDTGARGDGATKDTAALQKALDACAAAGGGEVLVPAGHYLTGSLVLGANITLQLDKDATLTGSPDAADYPLEQGRFEGEFTSVHRALLSAHEADHVAITGPGTLVGPPVAVASLRKPRGPVMIELTECNGVRLEDFTVHYQRLWSVHPLLCRDVVVRHVTIRSSLTNGDGIDVDSCSGVLIEQCDIDGGDDAISLKSGRGLAAMKMNRRTKNGSSAAASWPAATLRRSGSAPRCPADPPHPGRELHALGQTERHLHQEPRRPGRLHGGHQRRQPHRHQLAHLHRL